MVEPMPLAAMATCQSPGRVRDRREVGGSRQVMGQYEQQWCHRYSILSLNLLHGFPLDLPGKLLAQVLSTSIQRTKAYYWAKEHIFNPKKTYRTAPQVAGCMAYFAGMLH